MKTINLTPHKINIYNEERFLVSGIFPSGGIARIAVGRTKVGEINGYPVFEVETGEIEGLPEPAENTIYIVSGIFLANCPRDDLYAPGELLRDDDGIPIGCIGLTKQPQ